MNDAAKRAFGQRLRMARRKEKLTQEQLAHFLDLTKQAINHWERARWLPEAKEVSRLAARLHVSADWLLTGIEKPAAGSARLLDYEPNSIPRLTMAQLLEYGRGTLNLAAVSDRHVTASREDPETLVAFELTTRAMEAPGGGGIAENSVVTLKTDKKPEPGDVVAVALLAKNALHIGRWRPGPSGNAGEFAVHADNENFGQRRITSKDRPKLIGTMIEVLTLRSR